MERFRLEGVSVRLVKDRPLISETSVNCPEDLVSLMGNDLKDLDREEVRVIFFDTRNHPLAWHQLSIGSLDRSIVSPRELFKVAFLLNAGSIMLFHNHPGDDETPSDMDNMITERLNKICNLVGINLLDHVIVTPSGRYYSYAEKDSGRLKNTVSYQDIGLELKVPDLPGLRNLSLVAEEG